MSLPPIPNRCPSRPAVKDPRNARDGNAFQEAATEEFILIFALIGQAPAQLGTFTSYAACQNAIRQIFLMNIYKDAQDNPEVKKAIDIQMKYQQEYQCIKR